MHTIEEKDFLRLVQYVESNYGINLRKKKTLIEGRLSNTLDEEGFSGFKEYIDRILSETSKQELQTMIDKLTTNHTFFLRENAHFEFFKDTILPYLEATHKNRTLGIWSAGCSSGEEPYTLTMHLLDYFKGKVPKWDTRVLATDISKKVLSTALSGSYPAKSVEDIPEKWLRSYFTPSGENYVVKPEVRSNVIFREFNLMEPIRFKMKFDVIFCRNVMIYFEQDVKDALISRFYQSMVPGGYLLIGHSETLNKLNSPFQYIMPSVYRKV